jgi:anti-sigma B factor antagonist
LNVQVSLFQEIVGVVHVTGELTVFVEEFDLLYKEVVAYNKMGIFRFVLDLNDLSYIDSSGVGIIMRLATTAMKQGSTVCVVCEQPQVLKILAVSNVDKMVHFVKSVEEGLEYYKTRDGININLKNAKKFAN